MSTKRSPYCFQYAAKFICTSIDQGNTHPAGSLLPGNYRTAVNIHNPHEHKFEIRMKIASPDGISRWEPDGLRPDGVLRISCREIERFGVSPNDAFEGFLVIESPCSLDVTAVYTAGNKEAVVSIYVESIKERLLCA